MNLGLSKASKIKLVMEACASAEDSNSSISEAHNTGSMSSKSRANALQPNLLTF